MVKLRYFEDNGGWRMAKLKAVQLDSQDMLIILDQTLLPGAQVFIEVKNKDILIEAIAKLQVRGAPAIGIAAAYGIFVLAEQYIDANEQNLIELLEADIADIQKTRPTAVNLAWALSRMKKVLKGNQRSSKNDLLVKLKGEAISIDNEEALISSAIGRFGSTLR